MNLVGKEIAFVGASPILRGKGLGLDIDKYEITARTNGSVYMLDNQDFKKDYGVKCDLLFCNQMFVNMGNFKHDVIKKAGVKSVGFKHEIFPVNGVQSFSFGYIKKRLQSKIKRPNTGVLIWEYILSKGPKLLYITGVDFFCALDYKNHSEYIQGYLPKNVERWREKRADNIIKKHDFYSNAMYVKNFIATRKNVLFDPWAYDLLEKISNGEIKQND